MHHFHSKTLTVKDVSPGIHNVTLAVLDGLVEVEAIQVEGHCAYTKCGEPDADYRPGCKEEVQGT